VLGIVGYGGLGACPCSHSPSHQGS
jgi:hypothetical protein